MPRFGLAKLRKMKDAGQPLTPQQLDRLWRNPAKPKPAKAAMRRIAPGGVNVPNDLGGYVRREKKVRQIQPYDPVAMFRSVRAAFEFT